MRQASFVLPRGKDPDLSSIASVLVLVAHPDDIDFGCAGTVALFRQNNIEVTYCLVTSGEAGGDSDGLGQDQRKAMREAEQTAAAKVVGVSRLHFLRQPDGCIESNLVLREKITRVIRQEKPDLVITQSPERRYDRIYASHPDHLAVGEATICACYPDSQNPNSYPHLIDEGLAPHTVKAMWLMTDASPDVYVDITSVFDQKCEALFSHTSQISDQNEVRIMLEQWCAETARAGGFSSGVCSESFRFIQIMD